MLGNMLLKTCFGVWTVLNLKKKQNIYIHRDRANACVYVSRYDIKYIQKNISLKMKWLVITIILRYYYLILKWLSHIMTRFPCAADLVCMMMVLVSQVVKALSFVLSIHSHKRRRLVSCVSVQNAANIGPLFQLFLLGSSENDWFHLISDEHLNANRYPLNQMFFLVYE